jgi:hypothetical protein
MVLTLLFLATAAASGDIRAAADDDERRHALGLGI